MTNQTLLAQAQKIPVPEPGTGEIVTLPSVEALCVWMKLNNQKFVRWYGGILQIAPADVEIASSQSASALLAMTSEAQDAV